MFPDMPHVHLFEEDPQLSDPTVHLRPPAAVEISFAADVLKRNKQLILTETVSSFTTSCIIGDERRDTLRAALIRLCLELRPVSGPCALVRVDPAPGFAALAKSHLINGLLLPKDCANIDSCFTCLVNFIIGLYFRSNFIAKTF